MKERNKILKFAQSSTRKNSIKNRVKELINSNRPFQAPMIENKIEKSHIIGNSHNYQHLKKIENVIYFIDIFYQGSS